MTRNKKNLLRSLLLEAGKRQVLILVAMALFTSLMEAAGIGLGVSVVLSSGELQRHALVLLLVLLIVKSILQTLVGISRQHLITRFTDQLRVGLLEKVLHAPALRLQRVGRGELLGLLMSDVDRTTYALERGIGMLRSCLSLGVYGIGALVVGSSGALPLLLGLAATGMAALLQRSDAEEIGELYTRLNAALHRTVGDGLHGLKAVRAAGAERWWLGRYGDDTERFRRLLLRITRRDSVFHVLRDALTVLVVGIWLGVFRTELGPEAMVTTLLLTYRAAGSASGLIGGRREFLGALPGYAELCRIRRELGEPLQAADPRASQAVTASPLQMKSLAVTADPGRGEPLELAFNPCSLTAVVGPSGVGKTTLLDAFSGLMVGDSSHWRLERSDGPPLEWEAADADDWRRLVAYAPQETVLFEGSLRVNLLMGRHGAASDDEVGSWLEALGLEELLERPGGLEAKLQLSMDCFSGGEMRRLGLLRAWLLDRPIEVLDEPTSSLDALAAGRVRRILQERARQRTVLVATHDQGLIAGCDAVIDLSRHEPVGCVAGERTA